jgi:hypothetical protein
MVAKFPKNTSGPPRHSSALSYFSLPWLEGTPMAVLQYITASQLSGRNGTLGKVQVMGPTGADGVQGVKIEPAFVYGLEPAGSFELRIPSFEKKIAVGGSRFVVTRYRGPGTFFGFFFRFIIYMIFLRYFLLRVCFFRFFPAFFPLGRMRFESGQTQGLGQIGEEVLQQSRVGKFSQGSIVAFDQSFILVRGRLRAGGEEAVGQGLVGAGENLGGGGKKAALVGPLGGGQESVDGILIERKIQFVHEFDDTGALADSLENQAGIAFGAGSLSGAHDQFQEGIEDKQTALTQDILETILGLQHFFQQVLLVAMQGRLAKVVLLAELSQGGAPGK